MDPKGKLKMSTLFSLVVHEETTHGKGLACVLLAVLCLSVLNTVKADPLNVTVTRNILTVDVTATSPIAFGTLTAPSTTVSASASTVTNAGNETVTYSLSLANPAGWTAVQAAPGAGQYCLSAMFSTAQPSAGSFSYVNHALATGAPGPACSATQFGNGTAGESGLSVPASEVRSLWFRFESPASTTVSGEQTIAVTVTATGG
jgi:hypothetical protein